MRQGLKIALLVAGVAFVAFAAAAIVLGFRVIGDQSAVSRSLCGIFQVRGINP
jgi:hypothetical protein